MTADDRPLDRGIPQRGNPSLGAGAPLGGQGGAGLAGAFGASGATGGTGAHATGGMGARLAGAERLFAADRPLGTDRPVGPDRPLGTERAMSGARRLSQARPPDPDPGAALRGRPVPAGPRRRIRRGNVSAALTVLALLLLLVPVVLLFVRLWSATADASSTTVNERAAVAYARPVNKLLGALVDAERSAARKGTVDAATVRSAADEVDAVDRGSDDPLQVRSRWTQLRHEIDSVLGRRVSGVDAVTAYTTPIALARALLGQLAESAGIAGDRSPDATQLTRVALRDLPSALAEAGNLTALAVSTDPGRTTDARLAVAADRLAAAASDASGGLRAGTDPSANYTVDLNLLAPLDAFSAAADALGQLVAGLDKAGSGARDQLDAADTLLKNKALDLQTAVLDAFDTQLAADTQGHAGQRRELVLAAVAILLAAVALLWLGVRGRADAGYPDAADEPRPGGPSRTPDLVDARDLMPGPLVPANGGGRSARRRDSDDPR